MARMKVVVTGASGYIAAQLLPEFRQRYDLTMLDVRNVDRLGKPVPGVQIVDLSNHDIESYRAHFRGAQAAVHLAFNAPAPRSAKATYLDERANLDLAQHVYQVSMEEKLNRVVVASSNHAADWYEHGLRARKLEMLSPYERPLSDNWYGWAKACYEHMGFMYATGAMGWKLPNVQIRIGAPRPIDSGKAKSDPVGYKRDLGAYISPRDLQQLFIRSIEAENIEDDNDIPFQVFYGVSNNTRAFWALDNARRVIGYAPQDDSELVFAADIRAFLIEAGHAGRL